MLRDTIHSLIEQVNAIALCFSQTTCKPGTTQSRRLVRASQAVLVPVAVLLAGLTGCGSGGYAGSGITSLSNSAITIDAGQSFQVTAALTGNEPVSWSVAGSSCTAAACGTLSGATGATTTYTAPAGLASQIKVTLTASLSGTSNSSVANITVNPDPAISGNPPAGTVGTPYQTTLTASGGTPVLKWSVVGSLPPGLTFDTTTGAISGTPTTTGSTSFSAQIVDSSDVPYTAKATETIAIGTAIAPLVVASGNPPSGTVGVAYTSTLSATGGTTPYSWSLISGSLPAGLSLSAGGVISGTPTAQGPSDFAVQVEDASGTKTNASMTITINTAGSGLTLTMATLPNGIVGVSYSTTIGVSGGTAPYSCLQTGGALPPGLTLTADCVVSGTPTTVGAYTLQVKASDSGSPTLTVTGPETINVVGSSSLALVPPPNGTAGVPYTGDIGVSGGTPGYTCSVVSGTLPAGLTLGAGCAITGTPTTPGTSNLTVTATDSSSPAKTVTGPVSLTIAPSTLSLTLSTMPSGTVGVAYTATVGVSGGTAPYTCTQAGGTLPPGLTLSAACVVSGTPTTAGPYSVQVKATDSANPAQTVTGPEAITISAAPILTLTNPPGATVNTPYTGTIGVSGGTAPYTCQLITGPLPTGLTLGANCVITGTPTTAGTYPVTVKATDTGSPVKTTTAQVTVSVSPAALSLTLATLPGATVGTPYTATVGVSGGIAPYSCQQTGGTIPPGLTLSAACVVSGTPTTAGPYSIQVTATDSNSPAGTVSGPESITVSAAANLTLSNPPAATLGTPYTGAIGVTGGTAPYTCQLISGTVPPGLTLGANCAFTGTPTTAGSYPITVKATDNGSPAKTGTAPVTVTVSPTPLTLTLSTLPNGTVGTPYGATIGVSGGTSPYSCSITSGTLPAGLTLGANCLVSGTPTVADSVILTVKATDASNPVESVTGPVGLTIAASPTLTLSNPPAATVNDPYTGTIGVTGGKAPYSCTITAGTLPAGLTLGAACVITGTPTTAVPPTTVVTVKATDSSSPAATTTGPVTITVNPATATLTLSNPPAATLDVPYTGTIGVTGGTAPYNCTITSGTLPAGLHLGAACVITGTPTSDVPPTTVVTVKATDSATPTADTVTGPVTITVNPVPTLSLTGSLPNAIKGVSYSQTLVATGGIQPYTYTLTAGTLPGGLTLSPSGTISGTPTTVGASSFTVTVTDTEPTPQTASLPLVLLVVYPTTPTDSELKGPYAFLFQGYDDVVAGVLAYETATVGSFTADGTGVIGSGELDTNHQTSNPSGNTVASNSFVGSYTLGTDSRGMMTITTLNADGTTGSTSTYAIAVKAPVSPATVATQASLIEYDDDQLVGTRGSGSMLAQSPVAFGAGLQGSWAFGMSGDTPCLPSCTIGIAAGPVASVGEFTTDGSSLLTDGTSDANIASTNYADTNLTGSYAAADGNGRLALTMTTAGTPVGIYPTDYAVYMVSANQAFVMSTDKHSSYLLLAGTTQLKTQPSFSNASMNSAIIGYENAQSDPGLLGVVLENVLNLSTATIFRATGNGAGHCDFTNVDTAGVTGLVNGLTGLGSGSSVLNALLGTYQSTGTSVCTVADTGRGVLNYPNPSGVLTVVLQLLGLSTAPPPAREFYLISPNNGYFLETGYAGLGRFEPQSGTPSTLASFSGKYIYASLPAASLASINSSGFIQSNGTGSATSTLDLNVGVGTINVLQLGTTSTQNYTLSNAADGRFVLGTTTILYEIAPGRFALVDTNALTTSPTISLLY
jgi:large repetitive protein